MPKLGDNRRIPGDRVRVPNALRISADDGNYFADLRDISVYGLGVEYFDMLNFLEVTPNDTVVREFLIEPEGIASEQA